MKNRRLSFDMKTTTPNRVLEVAVTYDEGGANHFTGGTKPRGFYLAMHVCDLQASPSGQFIGRRYELFSRDRSGGTILERSQRYNAKRLQALYNGLREHPEFSAIRDRLLAANGLTLAEEEGGTPEMSIRTSDGIAVSV